MKSNVTRRLTDLTVETKHSESRERRRGRRRVGIAMMKMEKERDGLSLMTNKQRVI